MYKERVAEKGGNKGKTDTTAALQGAMIETWEYTEDDYVFAFGEAVIAVLQRQETHTCVDSGASRSACPFGYAPDVSAKGKGPPLFSIDGSPIEQSGYKKVHWEKRDSAGETKRIGSMMVEPSVLFPVASVSILEENGTCVVFSCSGDYYFIRPPSQSQGVSHVKLQKHNGTYWLHADRRVTVDSKSFCWIFFGADGADTRGWSCVVISCGSGRSITEQRLEEPHKRPFLLKTGTAAASS